MPWSDRRSLIRLPEPGSLRDRVSPVVDVPSEPAAVGAGSIEGR